MTDADQAYAAAIERAADGREEPTLPLALGWQRRAAGVDSTDRRGWTVGEETMLRRLWPQANTSAATIAPYLPGRSRNAIIGKAHALGLPPKPQKPPRARGLRAVRKAFASLGDDVTLSRFVKVAKPHAPTQAELLASPRVVDPRLLRRPAIAAGRSIFHVKGISDPAKMANVLVSGHSNVKIGRDVRKGPLRGYWIYTLSLEERATCPNTCHHWATCYGNGMPYANRVDHRGQGALQEAIEANLRRLLAIRGRRGVLVRLHALGDFFAPSYVEFWQTMLALHDRLSVYGYTAWDPTSPIGAQVAVAKALYGRRFAVRWSNGTSETDCALPVQAVDEPVNAVVCPEQTGRTAACATCALCWGTSRNIAFIEH